MAINKENIGFCNVGVLTTYIKSVALFSRGVFTIYKKYVDTCSSGVLNTNIKYVIPYTIGVLTINRKYIGLCSSGVLNSSNVPYMVRYELIVAKRMDITV